MAFPSSLSLITSVLEQEKQIFKFNNPDLSEDELQRRWTAETAKLHSVLGSTGNIQLNTAVKGSASEATAAVVGPGTSPISTMKRERSVRSS